MRPFATKTLPLQPEATAPDGSDVRILLGLGGGGLAHFELAAGRTSSPVAHRTVEEIWFILSGEGEMWRSQDGQSEITPLHHGVCLTIPLGTHFQFRAGAGAPLRAVAVTMPPWPGDGEAFPVDGPWPPSPMTPRR